MVTMWIITLINKRRYKDGQEVRADARIKITRDCTRLETYNLTLNLIKREDAGDYEVKATNTMGSAGTKSHVTVLSKYLQRKKLISHFVKLHVQHLIHLATMVDGEYCRVSKCQPLCLCNVHIYPLFNHMWRIFELDFVRVCTKTIYQHFIIAQIV